MSRAAQAHLAVTIAPLGEPAAAIAWASSRSFCGVQLSATQPGMRPRDLGPSARRDLRATLTRHEVVASGIDALVPTSHLVDPQHSERAVDAICAACELAAELGRAPVVVQLPEVGSDAAESARRSAAIAVIAAAADRVGVSIADLSGAGDAPWPPIGIGIDPAALLAAGGDPAVAASRAGSRLVAARVVDQLRSGLRGPIGLRGDSRLDPLAFRIALDTAGFRGLPVVDCRQWTDPRAGAEACLDAWPSGIGA
jgi:sugar phosphate isomerase/epimerase